MLLSNKTRLRDGPLGGSVVAVLNLPVGDRLLRLSGPRVATAGKHTIQRAAGDHVSPDGADWAMLNHACDPNSAIDFATWELVARRPIASGDDITFSYLTTEWELAAPFDCACGAPNCVKIVRGFGHLDQAQRVAIRALISPYLQSVFHMRLGSSGARA